MPLSGSISIMILLSLVKALLSFGVWIAGTALIWFWNKSMDASPIPCCCILFNLYSILLLPIENERPVDADSVTVIP